MLNTTGAVAGPAGQAGRRAATGVAFSTALVLAGAAWSDDASAATAFGGLATSVGLLTALLAMIAVKGWSLHAAANSIGSAGGALALGAGALLLWRGWRGAIPGRDWLRERLATAGARRAQRDAQGAPGLPPGVDAVALGRTLVAHFMRLQRAWDNGDFAALAKLTTPEMLDELREHRHEYGGPAGSSAVKGLRPALLGYERRAGVELVCVEFSGTMHEHAGGRQAFRELWMLLRADGERDWRLARQQMLL